MSSKDFCILNISPIYLNTTDVAYPLLGFDDAHYVLEASVVENIKRYVSLLLAYVLAPYSNTSSTTAMYTNLFVFKERS